MADRDISQDVTKMTEDANIATATIVVRPDEEPISVDSFSMGNVVDSQLDQTSIQEPLPNTLVFNAEQDQESATLDLINQNIHTESVFTGDAIKVVGKVPKPVSDLITKKVIKNVDKAKPPHTTFNYLLIESEDGLKQHMEMLSKAQGYDKYKTVDFTKLHDDLMSPQYAIMENGNQVKIFKDKARAEKYVRDAEKTAEDANAPVTLSIVEQPIYDSAFIKKMVSPKYQGGKTIADYKDIYKQFQFLADVSNHAYELGQKVAKGGTGLKTQDILDFQHAVTLEGIVAKKIKKQQVDIARSLGVLNVARKPGPMQDRLAEEAMDVFGGQEAIKRFAKKYVSETDHATRTKLAEQLNTPWYKKVQEIIPSIYVTGLISQVDSHLRNILGFAGMRTLMIPENFIAVGWGKARTYLFKDGFTIGGKTFMQANPERMVLDEAIIGASFEPQYWGRAWSAFKKALMKNELSDPLGNKVIQSPVGRRAFEYNFGNNPHEKFASKSIEYMGTMATISGRIMMAEDEFMKSLTFWRSIEMQVVRKQYFEAQRLIERGMSYDDAHKKAAELAETLLESPTEDMIMEAIDYGRYATNTQKITGTLGSLEKVFNNPWLKVHMPFMRVVSNVFGAANERNPFTFYLTPRFWKNWNAGGVQRDLAMARVTMGGGWGYVISKATQNGYITGAGAFGTYEDRLLAEKQGWQPYSFVFNTGELSPEKIKQFQKLTNVSITKDKIYVSYKGIEPISILLAQFASLTEFAYNTNATSEDIDLLYTSAVMSTYDYMTEHPLMQTMASMASIIDYRKDAADELGNSLAKISEIYSTYALQGIPTPIPQEVDGETVWIGGPWSGFQSDLERSIYPEKTSTAPAEMIGEDYDAYSSITNPAIEGYNTAFSKICAKTQNCSPNLPASLDPLTGQIERNGLGNTYDLYGPFKTTEGLIPGGYTVLAEFGANRPNPKQNYKSIDGVTLSASQINGIIRLATKGGKLDKTVIKLGERLRKNNRLNKIEKAEIINETVQQMYAAAKDQYVMSDRSLRDAIARQEKKKVQAAEKEKSVNTLIGDR